MSIFIDHLHYRDAGKRHAADLVMLRCDGCHAFAPRDTWQLGESHWSFASARYGAQRHGWTDRVDHGVLRDYCAKCSAPKGVQLALEGVTS